MKRSIRTACRAVLLTTALVAAFGGTAVAQDLPPADVPTAPDGLPNYEDLLTDIQQDAVGDDGGGGSATLISVSRTGGSARAYVSFASRSQFYLSGLRVSDTACDSHALFVQIRVTNTSGGTGNAATYNTEGLKCGNTRHYNTPNPYYASNAKYVALRLCVNMTWGNDCTSGNQARNPYI